MDVICRICGTPSSFLFSTKILNKYDAQYYHCTRCGFIQATEPVWLDEAYVSPINIEDTGLVRRNLLFAKRTSAILFFLFNPKASYLDYAGGNGLFVRLMRDIGFDFYWSDPYAENVFARGFEYNDQTSPELITTFESFEHFNNPVDEIKNMLSLSRNLLFSTEIYKGLPPAPEAWDYYSFSHGQHISFYSSKTLQFIADKFSLNLYSNGKSFHLLTEKKLSNSVFNFLLLLSLTGLSTLVSIALRSKTREDSQKLSDR